MISSNAAVDALMYPFEAKELIAEMAPEICRWQEGNNDQINEEKRISGLIVNFCF